MSNKGRASDIGPLRLCDMISAAKQGQGDVFRQNGRHLDRPRAAGLRARSWLFRWWLLALVAGLAVAGEVRSGAAQATPSATGASGLALPRFVSLKSDRVNLRAGPGTDYPTVWEYRRAGLPIEILEEFEVWRKVRDSEGATGWVLGSLLSGRRTALVLPWDAKPDTAPPRIALYNSDSTRARQVALIEAGVIANVHGCDGRWCTVTIDTYRGYIEQSKLWGVYENEAVK